MGVTLWSLLIGGTVINLVQLATDQVSVHRHLTATSLKEAQRALWLKFWLLIPVFIVFYLTGLVLYAFYQIHGDPLAAGHITKPDQILPFFVITELPAGLPGLLIAAIYSGTMSATSSGINALTTATLVDHWLGSGCCLCHPRRLRQQGLFPLVRRGRLRGHSCGWLARQPCHFRLPPSPSPCVHPAAAKGAHCPRPIEPEEGRKPLTWNPTRCVSRQSRPAHTSKKAGKP